MNAGYIDYLRSAPTRHKLGTIIICALVFGSILCLSQCDDWHEGRPADAHETR